MDDELALTDNDPLSSCSNSSLLPHCSSGELFVESLELKSPHTEVGNKNGRARKLLQKYNLVIPELKVKSSFVAAAKSVDLSLPDEKLDPWLTKKFPLVKKRTKALECQENAVQKGMPTQQQVREHLLARMAVRRKVEQQKRNQLYAEDNEDVLGNDDEEEENTRKREKTKLKQSKPVDSDNSEDDEDYVAEDDDDEDSDTSKGKSNRPQSNDKNYHQLPEVEDEMPAASLTESEDIFGSESPMKSLSLASQKNIFPSSCSPVPAAGLSQFPSFSQWHSSQSEKLKTSQEPLSDDEFFDELNNTVIQDNPNNEDLLLLCSGQFDFPATTIAKDISIAEVEGAEEDEDIKKPSRRKSKRFLDSDDENEEDPEIANELESKGDDDVETENIGPKRVVLISDDEEEFPNSKKLEANLAIGTPKPTENNDYSDEEDEEDEEEEVKDSEVIDKGEENDSDDELAVIRHLENKEHKRKLKRGKFFDDEASLSGSDVGSDLDEDEDENNEYEADDCDKEEYDQEEIRDKNHKLFLKQQQQQVHREIAKLQDKLLADGDLAGVETNRTFRVRLREDVEIDSTMQELNDFSQDSVEDDNVDEENQRADAIKFRAEMQNVLSQMEDVPMEDDIERAAQAATLSEIAVRNDFRAPTLIGKTSLASVFKDINGPLVAKQMYTTTGESGGLKRTSELPLQTQPKKQKLTLFDTLDD